MAYQCANCSKVYQQPTADFFCTDCGYDGLLVEVNSVGSGNTTTSITNTITDAGLCILLMDASGSMHDPAFPGSPLSKLRLIAVSAALGIFGKNDSSDPSKSIAGLQQLGKADSAYICGIKFDHRVEQMFFCSVQDLLAKYNDHEQFANYLYNELNEMRGATDINGALRAADSFAQAFKNNSIPGLTNYSVMEHIVYTRSGETKNVPNIRVLMYTDGIQYTGTHSDPLYNPFQHWDVDVLMGAFFGQHDQDGCSELRDILSKCPSHGFEQFFLLDHPSKTAQMRKLFRMASGASGFCPLCLPKE